jgi:DnaK suppressor protein
MHETRLVVSPQAGAVASGGHGGEFMSAHLTDAQRTQLRTALEMRQSELDQRLAAHRQGLSRADHAREVLQQDGDDAPQRDSDREVELALSDQELQELGEVSRALQRLPGERYGLCTSCGVEIPFDRLKLEPQAMRCVACEAKHEQQRRNR